MALSSSLGSAKLGASSTTGAERAVRRSTATSLAQQHRHQHRQHPAIRVLRSSRAGPSSSGRRAVALRVSAEEIEVEGAFTDFCTSEVCTASPAVEQAVRSLATDITMFRWSERLFQPECAYNDKFRSFKGRDKYKRMNFVKDHVEDPKAVLLKLKMTDKSNSWIQWKLTGKIAGQVVEVDFTEEFEHNQVTGRVVGHKEIWHAVAGGMLFNTQRATWSASQASSDTKEMIDRTLDSLSMDEGGDEIYRDPSDPTKFFQKGEDEGYQDMISYALVIAVIWLIFQGYSALNTM
mmetsp:Transcript_6003/g.15463  ORF Transcript_6003/g.15463 Transcript_6003/m.15463 type:complete len:292 (-) Transcript_6003:165-1040(-)